MGDVAQTRAGVNVERFALRVTSRERYDDGLVTRPGLLWALSTSGMGRVAEPCMLSGSYLFVSERIRSSNFLIWALRGMLSFKAHGEHVHHRVLRGDLMRVRGSQRLLLSLSLTSVLTVGCALGGEDAVLRPGQETSAPEVSNPDAMDMIFIPINEVVHRSQAAITGEVLEVSEARWNSDDNQPFDSRELDTPISSDLYRWSKVRVDSVLWSTPELPLQEGEEVAIWLLGDGSQSGSMWESGCGASGKKVKPEDWRRDCINVLWENELSGRVDPGTNVLMLLNWGDVHYKSGEGIRYEKVIVLSVFGNWTIEGDQATSLLRSRSAPLQPLIARLEAERARGLVPSDRRGLMNPLE